MQARGIQVECAVDLVQFEPQYERIMDAAFGRVLVVNNLEVANAICKQCKIKCVTMEGDVVDPSGTVSGGWLLLS